MEVRRNQTSE